MDNKEPVKKDNAVFKGDRVECWKCRSLLMKKIYPHGFENITGETGAEFMRQFQPRFTKKVESEPYAFEMKCKDRNANKGKFCNAVNIISL